ncbi:hypothetical protein [Archangium sp.]|uniref:hypothetical protein n=1 Tax=Archangium sp. TaxID=1872627 RepID=UPI003899BF21
MAALTVGAFLVRLSLLLESPEPPGTDGYYYVVQVEHWLAEGRFHVRDASWVLRVIALGCAVLGGPVGVKAVSALLAALCVPAAWFAGLALGRGYPAAFGLAAWAAASPTLTHLAGDFPKTLGAVAPLLVVLAWVVSGRRGWGAMLGGLVAVLLAATAHRLGASLLGLGAVGAGLGLVLRGRGAAPERKWPLVLMGVLCVASFAVLTTVLPNLLHPKDLERVSSQLDLSPGVPPPFPYFALRHTWLPQQVELGASWLGLVCGAVLLWRRRESRPLVMGLVLPLAVCLFPLWRRDVLDLGYRISLLAPLLAAPLVLLALPSARPGLQLRLGAVALVTLALLPLARFGFEPGATPPYGRYRALISRIPQPLPGLLIAHQGMNFLYDHVTGHEAMAWAPEPGLDRTRIGRLVWGVRDGEWMAYAPTQEGLPGPVRLDRDYVYVREDVYEAFLARAREEGDEDLAERLADWRNPSAVRPESLLRNRD